MLFPRFTLRAFLAVITIAALFFLLVGTGYRGNPWAWGAAIGILSLALVALVHATFFAVVWCFAQLSTARSHGSSSPRQAADVEATP
jgi:hypothetical protein